MFTVVTRNSSKKINFKSIKLSCVKFNDARFCLLQVKNKKKVNWAKIEKILGDTKTRTIFADTIYPPCNNNLSVVDDTSYSHLITLNALTEILDYHKEYLENKTVILVDVFCKYQDYADVLLKYFSTLKIVTNKVSLYNDYKDNKFYECGAVIIISSSMVKLTHSTVLFVSPDGIIFPCMTNQHIPIITIKPLIRQIDSPVYHSFESEISDELLKIIPLGVSTHFFQAALYEYCGMRSLSNSKIKFGFFNNYKKSIKEIQINILPIDMN